MNSLNEKQKAYLKDLSSIDTPPQISEQSQADRDKEVCLYCDIRNAAKEILANPEKFEMERGGLMALVEKAKKEHEEDELLKKCGLLIT